MSMAAKDDAHAASDVIFFPLKLNDAAILPATIFARSPGMVSSLISLKSFLYSFSNSSIILV